MLIDLIAAHPEEASVVVKVGGASDNWPTLAAKTVDQVKLASLAFILRGAAPDDAPVIEYMKTFQPLADGGAEGPWVDKVPNDLIDQLAKVTQDRIEALAAAWAHTEEAQRDGWCPEKTASFLRELVTFTAAAKEHPGSMLLRVCL